MGWEIKAGPGAQGPAAEFLLNCGENKVHIEPKPQPVGCGRGGTRLEWGAGGRMI